MPVAIVYILELVHINKQEANRVRFVGMPLTFNIATGFGFGFISFVLIKALTGRFREVSPFMCAIAFCFGINFALRLH